MKDPYNPKDNPWFQAFDGEQIKFVTGMTAVWTEQELEECDGRLKQHIERQIKSDCQKDDFEKIVQIINLSENPDFEFKAEDFMPMIASYDRDERTTYYYAIPVIVRANFTLIPTPSKVASLKTDGLSNGYAYTINVCYEIDFRNETHARVITNGNQKQRELFYSLKPYKEYGFHLPAFTTERTNRGKIANTISKQLQSFYFKNRYELFKNFKKRMKLDEIYDWLRLKYR